MAYELRLFDELVISPYLMPADQQDIGTGAALTSFMSLPGGGFYDNYRSRRSPQGIRPINKSGILWGNAAELKAQIDAWRGKIGKRGKLTVQFDDGSMRWQWARLQDFSAPRPGSAKGGWLAFSATWITAAQNWRGVVRAGGWTWGDDTWVFGDGSAEFGVGAYTFDISTGLILVPLMHNGNIDATNLKLTVNLSGTWKDLVITNTVTGQLFQIVRPSANGTPFIEIDTASHSVYLGQPYRNIQAVTRAGTTLIVVSTAHGMATGDTVRIVNTGIYDGDYFPITVTDANTYTVQILPQQVGWGTVTTGNGRLLTDAYKYVEASDRERWLSLAPGSNTLRIYWNDEPTSATLTVEYADHYA